MIKQSKLQFERDPASVRGFASANRASTDALNALEKWKIQVGGRDYEVTEDGDEIIRVLLTYESDDQYAAGESLNQCCIDYGVQRNAPRDDE